MKPRRGLAEDIWELYDTRTDFSLVNDLSKKEPKRLAEMKALFMKEAEKNYVLPIDDRVLERVNAALAGRPDLMAGRTSLTLAEGMTGMTENVFLNIKNKSKTITADVEVPEDGGNGAIIVRRVLADDRSGEGDQSDGVRLGVVRQVLDRPEHRCPRERAGMGGDAHGEGEELRPLARGLRPSPGDDETGERVVGAHEG